MSSSNIITNEAKRHTEARQGPIEWVLNAAAGQLCAAAMPDGSLAPDARRRIIHAAALLAIVIERLDAPTHIPACEEEDSEPDGMYAEYLHRAEQGRRMLEIPGYGHD